MKNAIFVVATLSCFIIAISRAAGVIKVNKPACKDLRSCYSDPNCRKDSKEGCLGVVPGFYNLNMILDKFCDWNGLKSKDQLDLDVGKSIKKCEYALKKSIPCLEKAADINGQKCIDLLKIVTADILPNITSIK